MKLFFKKYKWLLLLGFDLLLIFGGLFCRWLSGRMLETETTCLWLLLGGQCVTCGGTHFVSSLLHGQIIEAFHHNEFLFICTVYLAVSLVLLHPYWLLGAKWAKKLLRLMYNIPTLLIFLMGMFLFLILRNLTPIKLVVDLLIQLLSGA